MMNNKLMEPGKWYAEFDENGNCTAAVYDASFRRLLGFETEEEYANAQETWTSKIHPEDEERLNAHLTDCLAKHPEGKDFDIEYRMMTRNGYRWFHDYANVTRREDGSVIRADGVVFDIQEGLDKVDIIKHEQLRNDLFVYMLEHNDDPVELLKAFAERLRVLIDCDQVIYRDLEETRIMVNSPEIEKTWAVPIEYCQQCEHFDAHHTMYAGGYTEMSNCQEGWQGIPVYKDCPIKSSLTRLVYCDGEIAGYLAIHYVQKYHEFADIERTTLETLTRIMSMSLSRYNARKRAGEVSSIKKTLNMISSLADQFDPIIVIDPKTGEYDWLMSVAEDVVKNTSMSFHGDDFYKSIAIDSASIIHEDDRARFRAFYTKENMMRIAETGEPQETETRWFIATEGRYKWKFNKAVRMVDENGKAHVVVGVIDTTEAKEKEKEYEAQKKLIEQQQLLSDGLAREYHTVWLLEGRGEHRMHLYRSTGKKTIKDAVQMGLDDPSYDNGIEKYVNTYVHEDDRERVREETRFETIERETPEVGTYVVSYRRYNPEHTAYDYHQMVYARAASADGELNYIFAFRDADKMLREQMEQQRLLQDALESEKTRARDEKIYQRAILNNAYSYYRINISKNSIIPPIIERVNGQAVDYTDKFPTPLPSYEDVIAQGAKLYVDDSYKDSYRERQNCDYLLRCFNEGNMMPEYICRIYSSNLGWHYRKYVTYLSKDEATGDILGMSVAYDVSKEMEAAEKEKQYRAELEEARNRAETANKSKTDFLFSMSHDIRTPMNAITGFTNMAIKHIDDREKVLDCLGKTQRAGSMLLSLINSILEVSRIEAGHATLDEQPGDVYYSFANIDSTMHEMAEARDIDLSFEFGDIKDRYVYADFSRSMRIFVNVISNAIKYTKEGGYVKVRCEQLEDETEGVGTYCYTVTDNGIGMSEEFQKHIFDQFARENSALVSGVQGSGLGMSVVKSFVDLMGGRISVKSKQGEGSTFTIILPFRIQDGKSFTDPVSGEVVSPGYKEESADQARFEGKKILLVEDNELNREIAGEILEEKGLLVEEAFDGQAAVDIMKEKGPDYYDFILMDIQMPVMNGYDATRSIRAMYPDSDIPIIAISANAFDEDRKASREAGMNDHVAKPINTNELFNTLVKYR